MVFALLSGEDKYHGPLMAPDLLLLGTMDENLLFHLLQIRGEA